VELPAWFGRVIRFRTPSNAILPPPRRSPALSGSFAKLAGYAVAHSWIRGLGGGDARPDVARPAIVSCRRFVVPAACSFPRWRS
jgi:hypothetical protein